MRCECHCSYTATVKNFVTNVQMVQVFQFHAAPALLARIVTAFQRQYINVYSKNNLFIGMLVSLR